MKPQIVQKVIKSNGEEIEVPPKEVRQVISQKTSDTIKAMLISVVKNGWSVKAAVPGYLIGAKTGTAQIPNPNGGGYSGDFIHTFICGAPMNDPRFVILTKLDKVKAVKFSSDSASPVTRQILEFLFDYYNISPTEDITDKEREQYKMYADRLKAFLGSDSDNPQELNSSHNIENQINGTAASDNNNRNSNLNSNTNSNGGKQNKTDDTIHTSIQGGAGD
jgi:membrane peptidoglycan carboxypeptidase